MKYSPHDYQIYAINFIKEHPIAAILLDMGMGKTSIVLAALNDLMFDSFEVTKVLIIAPLRVAKHTWSAEIQKWDQLRGLRYSIVVGTAAERMKALQADADIYIINRENVPWLIEKSGLPFDYDMVVIDELSSFKNWQAKRFKALMKVRPRVKRIVGLTGTPSSNGLMDLFAEYKVLDIGVGWKHSVAVPKEEQVIVENKHPGIITKEEFIKAQKIFREKRATKRVTEKDYPLWRKVKCGTCGRAMPFKDRIIRGRPYRYFACPHAQVQVGENGCSKEYIREDVLNGVVWESIKTLLAAADEAKEQVKQKHLEADQTNTKLVKKLAKLQKDREKCDAERFANVDQFMAGTLDKEVYQSRRADLTRKADRLESEITELEAKYHEAEVIQDDGVQSALETLDKFSDATELDQDIVGALIEKVLVYDLRHVEIRWKFSDEVMKLLQG